MPVTRKQDFVVLALDRSTGEVAWRTTVRSEVPHEGGHVTASLASNSPGAHERAVYAFFGSRGLHALDARNGEVLWRRDMSSHAGLGLGPRNVYVTDDKSQVWALDRSNSGSLWRQQDLRGRSLTAPAVSGEYVVVADFEGFVHWLAVDDGGMAGRVQLGDGVLAQPVVTNNLVLIYDRDGTLTALRAN